MTHETSTTSHSLTNAKTVHGPLRHSPDMSQEDRSILAFRFAEARRFLRHLGAEKDEHIFVTFDDSKAERKELTTNQRGSLLGLWDRLDDMNQRGAGIFVLPNAASGAIARDRAVKAIRAVYADFDPPETAARPDDLLLPPSMQVSSSPGRYHVYWRAHDVPVSEFRGLQLSIIRRFSSDISVHNPGRIMRLPGFYHKKNPQKPFLVHILATQEIAYDVETLTRVFPPAPRKAPTNATAQSSATQGAEDLCAAILNGENLHDNALRLVGRLTAQGVEPAVIRSIFFAFQARLEEARGADRVAQLFNGELNRMINGARVKGYAPEPSADDQDYVAALPTADGAIFQGLIGEVALAATEGREINPIASALVTLSWLSAQVGRDLYIPIGDTNHPLVIFTLHVGRSARGAKSEATGLVSKVHGTLTDHQLSTGLICKIHEALKDQQLCSDIETRGVSSPEGLTERLRDGNGEDDPGVEDKRLWLLLSEFSHLLAVNQRTGNPLTEALRELYDGRSLGSLVRHARITATDPHVAIHGSITPEELHKRLSAVDIYNGFLNRFLLSYSERVCYQPLPRPTDAAVVADLSARLAKVVSWAKGDYPKAKYTRALNLTARAEKRWCEAYRDLATPPGDEPLATLLARQAPMTRRIAAVYATAERALKADVAHLDAALAWAAHHRQTVNFLFAGDVKDREQQAVRRERSEKLAAFLADHSPNMVPRSVITKHCFSGRIKAEELDILLTQLVADRRIARVEVPCKGAVDRTQSCYRAIAA